MTPNTNRVDAGNLDPTYSHLVDLWTSGVRDYHSLLGDYLTANSIFVAAIGFLLARQPSTPIFTLLVLVLCVFGILMTLQMAIVLGRFSAQNAVWEWQLRRMEMAPHWTQRQLFSDLHRFMNQQEILEDHEHGPPALYPDWAVRQPRPWWAHRAVSFPFFFAMIYGLFLLWGISQLFGAFIHAS